MNEFVIELGKFGDPSSLAVVELLGFSEVQKIEMVGIDLNLVWRSMEIVSPLPKSANNTQDVMTLDRDCPGTWNAAPVRTSTQ
jgi:hypothetical protein